MVPIRENLLNPSKHSLKCPSEATTAGMECIVVHNTGNNASAENEVAYMVRNDSSTSFNVAVDDREIVVGVPLGKGAFAAGNRHYNARGIHVEICYSLHDSDLAKFKKAEKNAAEYIAMLLKTRGWDTSHVRTHQSCDGKYCPHRTLDLGWDRFIAMIRRHMTAAPEKPKEEMYRVRKSWTDAKSQIGAYKSLDNAKSACAPGYTVFDGTGKAVYTADHAAFVPYTVRATCDVLNIRRGPSTGYSVAGQIADKHLYTIVEESAGDGSTKGWGRLKSGAGYIALDWVERV